MKTQQLLEYKKHRARKWYVFYYKFLVDWEVKEYRQYNSVLPLIVQDDH